MHYSPTRVLFQTVVSQDACSAIERWIYISMSGYTFDASVRDISIHSQ